MQRYLARGVIMKAIDPDFEGDWISRLVWICILSMLTVTFTICVVSGEMSEQIGARYVLGTGVSIP
jgi:hypothetical protein